LFLLRRVLLVLYISTLLAIGFSPAVHWLERQRFFANRKRLPRWAAILVLYAGALGLFALLLWIILPPLFGQINELRTRMPTYLDLLQTELVRFGIMDPSFTWGDLVKGVQTPGVALSSILGAVQSVIGAIGTVVTVLLLPFYFLVEASTLQIAFLHLFSKERRPRVARITAGVTLKVGAWLSGQLLLGAVIGSTAAIGLWIIGVPYYYVLGLLRAKGILCVYGSGFGLPAADGFLRIVFLAPLDDLAAIYDDMAAFTADFLASGGRAAESGSTGR
jgi:predicted PurR-regulated permease PerM